MISTQSILICLFCAMLMTMSVSTRAQTLPDVSDHPLDDATRSTVIDELLKKIDQIYILPDVAKKMEATIRARQANHEYDSITSGQELAKVLTDDLRKVRDDDHLYVEYFPSGIPYDSQKPPSAADVQQFREAGRRVNYQFRKVEILDGGIGLLQIHGFYPEEWAQDTIAASMAFLANSDAIILDFRQNHGGSGATLLCSYFFENETHLSDAYNREENTTRQFWTYPIVPGKKLADTDLYILTSHETVSAPEAIAKDMQYLKRATVVGEPTHGGAHPTTIYRITDHFSAAIPFARTIHPGVSADDEEIGVKPDVEVSANQALLTAYLMALKKSLAKHRDDKDIADDLTRIIADKEKELATLQAAPAK